MNNENDAMNDELHVRGEPISSSIRPLKRRFVDSQCHKLEWTHTQPGALSREQ